MRFATLTKNRTALAAIGGEMWKGKGHLEAG